MGRFCFDLCEMVFQNIVCKELISMEQRSAQHLLSDPADQLLLERRQLA